MNNVIMLKISKLIDFIKDNFIMLIFKIDKLTISFSKLILFKKNKKIIAKTIPSRSILSQVLFYSEFYC